MIPSRLAFASGSSSASEHAVLTGSLRTFSRPACSIANVKSMARTRPRKPDRFPISTERSSVPAHRSRYNPSGGAPSSSRSTAFRRQALSRLRLSRWFSRSYRGAIAENIRRTVAAFSAGGGRMSEGAAGAAIPMFFNCT